MELVEKAVGSQDVHTQLAQKSELLLLDCLIDKRTSGAAFGQQPVLPPLSAHRGVIVGAPHRNGLLNLIRGSVIREVSNSFPEEIDLLVYA